VGYGLLLALYSNDQEYFNLQLDNAEKHMWNYRQYVLPPCPPKLPSTPLLAHSLGPSVLPGRDTDEATDQIPSCRLRRYLIPPSLLPSFPPSLPASTTGE